MPEWAFGERWHERGFGHADQSAAITHANDRRERALAREPPHGLVFGPVGKQLVKVEEL